VGVAALVTLAAPRVRLVPEFVSSRGDEAFELCSSAGLVLDEHQRLVIDAMLAVRADGKFAAFEVGVVEPRQNGKGGIQEARELAGVVLLGEKLLIHSAHEYATALEAFYRMTALVEEAGISVAKVRNAHGEQGIDFANGARLRYRTRTRGGGRGFSCDYMGLDEAMFLPEFAHAALLPTMSARPNPQVGYFGSAVDQEVHEHGIVFARVRERGVAGEDGSLAFFEWSLGGFDHPDEVPDEVAGSEGSWFEANPALGLRISAEHVGHERESLSARNFAVERLGVGDWPATDGTAGAPIGPKEWAALTEPDSVLQDPMVLCFDVAPDRQAAIGAAGRNQHGVFHVEVADSRPGTAWLEDRIVELARKHQPSAVVCDEVGPGASLLKSLEAALMGVGVPLKLLSARENAQACGLLVDKVAEEAVRHTGDPKLMSAIRGAGTRPLGDAWAWKRQKSSANISPLVAVTLALWEASESTSGMWVF
jgi:hypothetical protein